MIDADGTTCDTPVDGKPNLCDAYVTVKINGKEVHQTKEQGNTAHPIFNETFETGSIRNDSIIVFEMWDSDSGSSADDPMSVWSGNAEYYLTRKILMGKVSNANQYNTLSVATKLINEQEPEPGMHTNLHFIANMALRQ